MSLAPAERSKIRLYLGYADEFRYQNTRLEGIFGSLSDEAVDTVRTLLANVETVENLILTVGLANLGLKRVDEVWFADGVTQISQQRKAGRIYIGQLSILLGVPTFGDYFSGEGWPGDSFSDLGGGNGSGAYNVG